MVEIKYFQDASKKEHKSYSVSRIADFLKSGFSKDELINMRFFRADVLGDEINTEDGTFIDIDEGLIVVIDKRSLPEEGALVYAVAAAIAAVVSIALMPTPATPDVSSTKQVSATNSLSQAKNEPRVGERIDDIFGTVAKHTPPQWQVPYRIGVDNQEVEVNLLCLGRGQYEHFDTATFDGDTLVTRIPNASVNFYGPHTHPGNGEPYHVIGNVIDEKIGIYRQPNDLNASELLPPNDLDVAAANWRITTTDNEDGTYTVEFVGSNLADDEIDLTEYIGVGDSVDLRDICKAQTSDVRELYYYRGTSGGYSHQTLEVETIQILDFSGTVIAENVFSDRFSFIATDDKWLGLSNFAPLSRAYLVQNQHIETDADYVQFMTLNSEVNDERTYFSDPHDPPEEESQVDVKVVTYLPSVGLVANNIVGPVTIGAEVEEVIINCTSASGFFKLYKNNERSISAQVEVTYDQIDEDGNVIEGTTEKIPFDYQSNSGNVRFSVYQTYRIDTTEITNPIRLYMRRITNRDKSDNVSNVDKIEWSSIYTFEPISADWDSGDVTLAHWASVSNSQSRLSKERKFNLDVTRKITQYLGDGEFGPTESYATDDFSQILIHTALDNYCGRLSLSEINADGYLLMRDDILAYFENDESMIKFGYDFDDIQTAYDDMFILICDAVNCLPYVQNGVYDAFFEKRQDTSTMQITHRNKVTDSETCEDVFESKYDGVELSFRNRETGVMETISIPDDGSTTNPESITQYGCTTEIQAYRKALRLYYKQIYHTRNVEFDVDEFGRMIVPGQRIDSPDSTRFVYHSGNTDGYRVYDGEVVEINGLNIELSQPVQFTDDEDHYIQFTSNTGDNSTLILCSRGSNDFEVVLSSLPEFGLYDGYERDKTKFTFCSEQLRESIALLPKIIESKIDNGNEINTISSINYDSRYYQGDLETL
ncbi:host specificity factor TipJ family phage tail protein [Vibrio parahaemolyticus]|uniref:host specificity factor TipJ family phage tail protein n=1 Tax=Vibrio parahaemolyticus TaxID=670 RepID=UPI0030063FEC